MDNRLIKNLLLSLKKNPVPANGPGNFILPQLITHFNMLFKNLQSEKGKEKDKTYINSFSKIVFIQDKWVILS